MESVIAAFVAGKAMDGARVFWNALMAKTGGRFTDMIRTALFLAACSVTSAEPSAQFWRALHQVETSGRVGPILGDNGKALGPFQIHRAYHADSGVPGDYSRCADLAYSKQVVTAYLKRFAPKAWAAGDVRTLARVHNGGPAGHRKVATLGYAAKVQRAIGGAK